MRWRRATSPLQRTTDAKSAEIQTPVAWGADIARAPFQGGGPRTSAKGRPRPEGPAYQRNTRLAILEREAADHLKAQK
jgi:hypothetical protein